MNQVQRVRRFVMALAAGAACLAACPAEAALHLCDQTSYVLYAATGAGAPDAVTSQGWTRIVPGECATALAEPLKAAAYYVYARSSDADAGPRRIWGGTARICAKYSGFVLHAAIAATPCPDAGSMPLPFAPLQTGGAADWTMTFSEQSHFPTLPAARAAGLDRLLTQLGYKIEAGPGSSSASRDAALQNFRTRVKLPATADSGQLFAALEAEARKVVTPPGYSICNDGHAEIWAALGLREGAGFISRGWWDVPPGACQVAVTAALGRDLVYLFVTRHGNPRLVNGPDTFCIANTMFDIYGRERCTQRKLAMAGFRATNHAGLPGYIAHIDDKGLVLPQAAPK